MPRWLIRAQVALGSAPRPEARVRPVSGAAGRAVGSPARPPKPLPLQEDARQALGGKPIDGTHVSVLRDSYCQLAGVLHRTNMHKDKPAYGFAFPPQVDKRCRADRTRQGKARQG